MKKAMFSAVVCTVVLALTACGKAAGTGKSLDSSNSTVSTTTVTTSTETEKEQKPTRVNQDSNLSPGSPKNDPINRDMTPSRSHHSESHHSETHHSETHHE